MEKISLFFKLILKKLKKLKPFNFEIVNGGLSAQTGLLPFFKLHGTQNVILLLFLRRNQMQDFSVFQFQNIKQPSKIQFSIH